MDYSSSLLLSNIFFIIILLRLWGVSFAPLNHLRSPTAPANPLKYLSFNHPLGPRAVGSADSGDVTETMICATHGSARAVTYLTQGPDGKWPGPQPINSIEPLAPIVVYVCVWVFVCEWYSAPPLGQPVDKVGSASGFLCNHLFGPQRLNPQVIKQGPERFPSSLGFFLLLRETGWRMVIVRYRQQ